MPRITGADAKHYWVAYTGDQIDPITTEHIKYRMQMTRRHIHWLKTLGFTNLQLELDPAVTYRVASGTIDIHPRTMSFSNGTKRRTLKYPQNAGDAQYTDPIPVAAAAIGNVALEGETGLWHLVGRQGERQSNGVANYNGE